MSDSIKKYAEMYDKKLEEKMISKGFGEKDSHDEKHVMKIVCKHFNLELTDDWTNDCDHYIYEESTADGYSVWISTPNFSGDICVSENVFYYENDLASEFKQAIYDNDHGDAKIYLSMLYGEYWIQDAIQDIYTDLVEQINDECVDELEDEGWKKLEWNQSDQEFKKPSTDMLNLIANN